MQKLNLNRNKDDRDLIMGRLKKIFSSSHINLLLGSAFSLPFLETLNNIEIDLSKAVEVGDIDEEYKLKKSFFDKSILPILFYQFKQLLMTIEGFMKKAFLLKRFVIY